MDPHNTWSYLASSPTNGSLALSAVSSPGTIADERSPENQAAGYQYLHIPQDLRMGVIELARGSLSFVCQQVILTIIVIQAHNQQVREMTLLSMQVKEQNQVLWSIYDMVRNQTQASITSDTQQNTSPDVQQQSSPSSDGSFHIPRSQPEPDYVSPSGEQESSPSVTERRQGQDGRNRAYLLT
jgi:hypothetical protein